MALSGSALSLKSALVLVDPESGQIQRIIELQYNPETLSRTFQVQSATGEAGDRLDVLRLKGPAIETIKLDAEFDATDDLADPALHPVAAQFGLQARLAALETVVYPDTGTIQTNMTLAMVGTLELTPQQAPLVLFVWSRSRIVPVRITELSVTEELFDAALNPIRAKVSLTLRVLSVNDLPQNHRGTSLYLAYQKTKERLAALGPQGTLGDLGM
ncbi:MAG: hypothetical protein M3154_04000 [Candidatus Eremiobacteraeota bacterium]|nr:hypothetical protein [Candidatus Eremiobacteraeota bacterium]